MFQSPLDFKININNDKSENYLTVVSKKIKYGL